MLANLKVYQKLVAGFAVVTLTMLVMAVAIGFTLQAASRASDAKNASDVAETALNKVTEQVYRGDRSIIAFALTGDKRYIPNAVEAIGSIEPSFALALKNVPSDRPDLLAKVTNAHEIAGKWLDVLGMPRVKDMQLPDGRTRIEASSNAGRDLTTATLQAAKAAAEIITTWSTQETANEHAEMSRLMLTLIIGTSLGIVLSILAGWIITRSITRPLSGMIKAMGALAAGDVTVDIPALSRHDEVGNVGRAVKVFKDAAIDNLRLVAEGEQARALAEQSRADVEENRRLKAAEQHQVVTELAAGLSKLAAGDLTCDLVSEFAPHYEQLRSDFNRAIAELRDLVGSISNNTAAIQAGTDEITKASDDLSRRTEQQAASLEETAAALDQITATVKKSAEGSVSARDVVAATRQDAEASGQIVGRAVVAMSKIETSSQQIGRIIGVIDEIAFQTNLLALNAGVEAARAGDAGRGFAVVASEVRALAQRSAESAKEIKSLIRSSEEQVKEGVDLVSATGEALSRIVAQVGKMTNLIAEITGSAQEQATGLSQVNTAINQMDQFTQQNAAMVEESTAAAHSLSHETADLVTLIGRFDVGVTDAKRSNPTSIPPKAQPQRALKVAGGGRGTATWEEF